MQSLSTYALKALLGAAAGALSLAPLSAQAPPAGTGVVRLPASFRADRVYVRPVTTKGDTLVFYTDTGGGTNMLYAPLLARLALPSERVAQGPDTLHVTDWPAWDPGAAIPVPPSGTGAFGGRLLVVTLQGETAMLSDPGDAGFLGRTWFADRVWTFDYPAGQLYWRTNGDLPAHAPSQLVPLGFQVDSAGNRTTHFPRIRVAVAGDSLDMLFDTGATMLLTDSALAVLGDAGPARRASSFLSAAVFDRWRIEHPGWRVIERATHFKTDLIEVPEVDVAGQRVGPVWFERRPAGVFEQRMSQWMDRPIVGALGGNALRFFRVTADYPGGRAVFLR